MSYIMHIKFDIEERRVESVFDIGPVEASVKTISNTLYWKPCPYNINQHNEYLMFCSANASNEYYTMINNFPMLLAGTLTFTNHKAFIVESMASQ